MKILFVEDNEDILENLFEYFELKGHILDSARDGLAAINFASSETYDAIVLDIMLPRLDGLSVCKQLRSKFGISTPIVMLTAKNTLEDKLAGFEAGADDYLIKPFALSELEVRLNALVRRARGNLVAKTLQVADLIFNQATLEVYRGDQKIILNHIGRNILALLMQQSPKVVSRSRIEIEIWGDNPPDSDTLRTHMYNLRNAIDKPFKNKLLKTISREGYRLARDNE